MSLRRFLTLPALAVLVPLAYACAASRADPADDDRSLTSMVITAADIEESGAATAWDVIRRAAPHLQTVERGGRPISMRRRGRASIQLSDAPLVMLDGVRLANWRDLDLIPATTIAKLEILNGIEGSSRYGTNAVGGVIVIHTKK